MLKSVQGVYREGKVEFLEPPPAGAEGRVIVTFLAEASTLSETTVVSLSERGIDQPQASDLRHRLAAFVEDGDRPEMDVYEAEIDA